MADDADKSKCQEMHRMQITKKATRKHTRANVSYPEKKKK